MYVNPIKVKAYVDNFFTCCNPKFDQVEDFIK